MVLVEVKIGYYKMTLRNKKPVTLTIDFWTFMEYIFNY
jgi:hypothetical protein